VAVSLAGRSRRRSGCVTGGQIPLLFVQEVFPWGRQGSLREHQGTDAWQADVLSQIRDGLSADEALQIAIASGHGSPASCSMVDVRA
jgi:hypothetical protein